MVELGRVVRRFGSPVQQAAVVHPATNSIHYHRVEEPGGESSLQQLPCSDCPGEVMSLEHLLFCSGSEATRVRNRMHDTLVKLLEQSDEARGWIRNLRHFDLATLLKLLFPPTADSSPAQQQRLAVLSFFGAFPSSCLCLPLRRALTRELRPRGASILQQLRLLFVQHIWEAFSFWKERFYAHASTFFHPLPFQLSSLTPPSFTRLPSSSTSSTWLSAELCSPHLPAAGLPTGPHA